MNDKQIEIFLAVHRFSNCTQAAESMFMSQSAISKSIKSLEEELKCLLFNRINGKMVLTEAGQLMKDFSVDFLTRKKKLFADISCLTADEARPAFNIGGIPCTCEYDVMNIITSFQLNVPGYKVEYFEANQSELIAQLDSGALDVVFARVDSLSPAQYNTLVLNDDELVLICRADKLTCSNGATVDIAQLDMGCLVTFTHDSTIRALVEKQFVSSYAAMPYKVIECTRHKQILSVVSNGGFAILPKMLFDTSGFNNLNYYHIQNSVKTSVGFVWKRSATSKGKAKVFISWLNSPSCAIPARNGKLVSE